VNGSSICSVMAAIVDIKAVYAELVRQLIQDNDVAGSLEEIKKAVQEDSCFGGGYYGGGGGRGGPSSRSLAGVRTVRDLIHVMEQHLILDPDEGDLHALGFFVYRSRNAQLRYDFGCVERLPRTATAAVTAAAAASCGSCDPTATAGGGGGVYKDSLFNWAAKPKPVRLREADKTRIAEEVAELGWDDARAFLQYLGNDLRVYDAAAAADGSKAGAVRPVRIGLSQTFLNVTLEKEPMTCHRVERGLTEFERMANENGQVFRDTHHLRRHVCHALQQADLNLLARIVTENAFKSTSRHESSSSRSM